MTKETTCLLLCPYYICFVINTSNICLSTPFFSLFSQISTISAEFAQISASLFYWIIFHHQVCLRRQSAVFGEKLVKDENCLLTKTSCTLSCIFLLALLALFSTHRIIIHSWMTRYFESIVLKSLSHYVLKWRCWRDLRDYYGFYRATKKKGILNYQMAS